MPLRLLNAPSGVGAIALSIAAAAGCSRAMSSLDRAPVDGPAPGVPAVLAADRAARLSDVRYELHFTIPQSIERGVSGRATIRFRLEAASRGLALDFAGPASGVRVRANGRDLKAAVRDEHIVLPGSALRDGENEVALEFDAGNLALNRAAEFMYTLFVPARARLAFPCFDQPDIKGRYTLSLDVPAGWTAVSNGAERSRTGDDRRPRMTFAETRPIPTYLFAFAAGRFSVETADRGGRPLRMLHRETDAQKVARNRDAIFDLHAAALDWLERYTSIPYPFEKFDFLLVPAFQFGGMEHPGSIFYNATALLLDPSATQNQKLGRASLIAHETAHMWFGNLVTMKWFDDVWMKEVFANFMAAKIVNPSFPEINHELRFLYAHYPAAYDVDRTAGTNPIRQRLENLNEAGALYGAIIYQKAPIVMRQLEMILSPDGLRDGLRDYLAQHSFGNASWPDLVGALDRRTPQDLAAWSHAWVDEPGRPAIATTDLRTRAGTVSFVLSQSDPLGSRALTWTQQLRVSAGFDQRIDSVDVLLSKRAQEVTLPDTPAHRAPQFVLPTGGGIGYGEFVLDEASRKYLTAHLADIPDALTRGAALVTLWEEMLEGRVLPSTMFALLAGGLPRESDELSVQLMLTCLQQVFWKYLAAPDRDGRAPALEAMLRAGLQRAASPSLKSSWFNTLRDVGRTPATLDFLRRVWNRTETVPGLTLAEPDYINLSLELAVREVSGWKNILDEQQARIENPDRRAQFEFVRPALSADAAVREAFFEGLRQVRNRRREAWVLQAVAYLHHPLRAAASERLIPRSLELVLEIQRTGDIFFPKRWLDATFNGHRSVSAAETVRTFLDRIPAGYPERLRKTILAAADDLFRASRPREQ